MNFFKSPILLLASALLITLLNTGCTPNIALKTKNYQTYNNYSFKLIDQRPEKEKADESLSFSITNCAYGIYRIGDDDTTPERIMYLKNTLQKYRADSLKGLTIYVKKFTIHKNLQSHLRNSNPYKDGLIPGFLVASQCFAKADDAGGFSRQENPSAQPAAIINITLNISGRTKHYRIVHSGKINIGLFSVNEDLIQDAMEKAMSAILKSLRV